MKSADSRKNLNGFLRKAGLWLTIFAIVTVFFRSSVQPAGAAGSRKVFIPLTFMQHLPTFPSSPGGPVVLGLYAKGWLGDQTVVDSQMNGLSDWSGVRLTLAGTFADIVEPNYEAAIRMQLGRVSDNGYTPFVNLMSRNTAYEIAKGDLDQNIRLWAQMFRRYVEEGKDRMAFIAPLPEMNGYWTSYGQDAGNFKLSFQRIQNIFADEGVPDNSVRWVFAPNGWSQPEHAFENYYPGDDLVDAVGFSAYNYGYCRYPGHNPRWETLEDVTAEYIERMRVMAPAKPIFLTQVATSGLSSAGVDDEAKNQWFREGYAYLARTDGVRGVLYFNLDDDICDMAMYRTWGSPYSANYPGYRDAVQGPGFGYLSPTDLKGSPLTP